MPSLIAHLDAPARKQLLDDLNYLNIAEFRGFCDAHAIPYRIWIETDRGRKRTKETDRKAVVLDRIRRYLKTGRIGAATCWSAQVAAPSKTPPRRLLASHRLHYGWYDKKSEAMMGLMKRLTGGKFRDGAIARIVIREMWAGGEAPTFAAFAEAWLERHAHGLGEHPEAAWLTDRARGTTGDNWKAKRKRIAKRALGVLETMVRPSPTARG